MSFAVDRAINAGIDSARQFRKDGDWENEMGHPLWKVWWEAVVLKSDCPDYSDSRVHRLVRQNLSKR